MSGATPKELGYRMPAEWEPHERTWMMWPSRPEVWDDMDATKRNYAQVAHAIRPFEPVTMLVNSADEEEALDLLGGDIDLMVCPIDDSWARDCGPTFVVDNNGKKAAISFTFNAWGEEYTPYDKDNAVADAIAAQAGVEVFSSSLTAEGGGIHVDDRGTLLTTQTCFPNKNRNPDWSEEAIEKELANLLGAEKVIWLPGNPLETETNGHVDIIASFSSPGVVMMSAEEAPDHPWHPHNVANINALDGQTDAQGNPLQIVKIPEAVGAMPNNEMFCRSYINSYICNGGVVIPGFDVIQDGQAREFFQDLFPSREIVSVPIWSIGIGGGGIHCITQQEPKG